MKQDKLVKILYEYDIVPELHDTYFSFVTSELVPQLNSVGLELAEVWETVYGDYPQRLITFVAPDMQTVNDALHNERFLKMEKKLLRYVKNYSRRIVKYKPHFQF